jgi:hypothetical protein
MPHSLSRLFCQLCVEFQLVVKVPEQEHKQHTVCDCDEHQATPLQYCTRAWNPQFMLPAFVNCCFNPVRSWCTDTNCVWMLLRVASKRVKSTSAAQPGAALNCTLEFFILTAWLHMYRQSIHLYCLPRGPGGPQHLYVLDVKFKPRLGSACLSERLYLPAQDKTADHQLP